MDRSLWLNILCLGVLLKSQLTEKCYIHNTEGPSSDIGRSESERCKWAESVQLVFLYWKYWTTNSQHLHSFWTTDLSGTIPNSVKFEWKANQEQFCKALLTWLSSFSHSVQGYDMVIIFLKSFYLNHYTGTAHEIALTTSHEDRSYSKHVWFILNMGFQTADTEYTQNIHWYKIK